MKWLNDHAFDILKTIVMLAIAIVGAWGTMQSRLASIDQRDALQDRAIVEMRGTALRIEREYVARNDEMKRQLQEIQGQLMEIGKHVAVLADRAGYGSNRGGKE